MKNVDIVFVELHAKSGAVIGDCLRDAIQLAISEWRNVELVHNDTRYRVNVNDLLASVKGNPRT